MSTEQKDGAIPPEAVEATLDYLNDLVYGGDPTRREDLRPQAESLAMKFHDIIERDMWKQIAEQSKHRLYSPTKGK